MMTNYNEDNGSLFDELLSDPDESFLFGGGDIWQETGFNNDIEGSDCEY